MTMFDGATRLAGKNHLAAVTSALGRRYAATRNTDIGPGGTTSSALSPYLRRRLVLEEEAVAAAREAHGAGADKFVEEVFWRGYFKGHLETRPSLWSDHLALVEAGRARLEAETGLRRAYDQAVAGATGIDCFDDWAGRLRQENWLHNHTRMWFASIWIFTLGLPWALGAAFFLEHLLDGDPASNTLSWRWVAGLHTRGKAYAARAENIARYTEGRFHPQGLNETPVPLTEASEAPLVPAPRPGPPPQGEVALLLHLDDLHPESLNLGSARVRRVSGVLAHAPGAAEAVRAFDSAALQDGLARAAAHFGADSVPFQPGWEDGLPVAAAYAPVGPSAAAIGETMPVLREWDAAIWPRSTKGYFAVRAAIPKLLDV